MCNSVVTDSSGLNRYPNRDFYASANRSVAGSIINAICLYIWKLLNTISWHGFYQTYTTDAFWNRDECFRLWGQKVEVQVMEK